MHRVSADQTVEPQFFRLCNPEDRTRMEQLCSEHPDLRVYDEIYSQLRELVRIKNPTTSFKENDFDTLIKEIIGPQNIEEFGTWVYYPWKSALVHILDEKDFIEVRTNRNRLKLTQQEQKILSGKSIGVIGLSVGHSIATALAIERLAGEIRIADFDALELSNCNRINTPLHNLGLSKTTITARHIAEIDPFINVIIYRQGVTESNSIDFLTGGGKLDLLVEECDTLIIKLKIREAAQSFKIPVIMETNDRGMIDIERYALNEEYPILHGLISQVPSGWHISDEVKKRIFQEIIPLDDLSSRAKESLGAINKSIVSWPQLYSEIAGGTYSICYAARRILLGENLDSQRSYIDLVQLLN
jgi:molybdopterin/thiamine biosynthesis adenylyltransferase